MKYLANESAPPYTSDLFIFFLTKMQLAKRERRTQGNILEDVDGWYGK